MILNFNLLLRILIPIQIISNDYALTIHHHKSSIIHLVEQNSSLIYPELSPLI